jgi:hypothetical protein
MLLKTGLNNILLPIVEHCSAEQYCEQVGTIWAAKYCSGLFSTTLLQTGRFLQCAWAEVRLRILNELQCSLSSETKISSSVLSGNSLQISGENYSRWMCPND